MGEDLDSDKLFMQVRSPLATGILPPSQIPGYLKKMSLMIRARKAWKA